MNDLAICGFAMSVVAGLLSGGGGAPIKFMRRFGYEHWGLIRSVVGLVLLPWLMLLLTCPDAWEALRSVDRGALVTANLFSFAWGIAAILASLCLLRIGFSLTVGLLTGIGLPIGVLLHMVLRGTGPFSDSPGLWTPNGVLILSGVAVMVVAVLLLAKSGHGRDRAVSGDLPTTGSFRIGLLMASMAGLLQVGLSFAFVYSQGPIREALVARGAGALPANMGVWAATLPGGALVSVIHPLWLLRRKRSWSVFLSAPVELLLSALMGTCFFLFVMALGAGMLWLGALGASVGFGVYQAAQISSAQAVGFLAGEWRGVEGPPRQQVVRAIALLLLAVTVIAVGRAL